MGAGEEFQESGGYGGWSMNGFQEDGRWVDGLVLDRWNLGGILEG